MGLLDMIGHRLRDRSIFLIGSAVAVLISACSGTSGNDATSTGPASPTATTSPTSQPDRAGPVDIGSGRAIYLECQGTGSPTVVLVSGFGDNAEVWNTSPADRVLDRICVDIARAVGGTDRLPRRRGIRPGLCLRPSRNE